MSKDDDVLNKCGHRNIERVEALKEIPSGTCPACELDRLNNLKAENKRLREALSFDECILRFAKRMQYKLDKNKHKECATMNPNGTGRGWSHCMVAWLLERLLYEADELYEALGKRIANPEAALDEAADVGNFAMMIFDNVLAEQALKDK